MGEQRATAVVTGSSGIGAATARALAAEGDDAEQADRVYAGLTPLRAQDVAEVIAFAATRPPHVNLDLIVVKPRDQYSAMRCFRRTSHAVAERQGSEP
jgi:NADP-dependent 3-hydroxy acid dehydrogenase YdfG